TMNHSLATRRMSIRCAAAALACAALVLSGCESVGSLGKRIDYKSTSSAPALELPPELSQPRYDDRYTVTTASGMAAAKATAPKGSDLLPINADARVQRAGNERWIVAKGQPRQGWRR